MSARNSVTVFADRLIPVSKATRKLWFNALGFSVALLLLPVLLRMNGTPHADWMQFLGRFHPTVVHLPIGFVLLVPVLEIAGIFRPALREAAGFVLVLAFACCLLALTLGFLLAYGSGASGHGLSLHMWGGIVLTIGVMLCLLARPGWLQSNAQRAYPTMLAWTLLALVWTAHQGGSLTHGSGYLTQYMPAPLKRLTSFSIFGGGAPSSTSFYAQHIHSVLDANCVSCHGDGQVKGGLRLDSFDALMKGGKDGPVIVPGNPEKSLLLERVTLPVGHEHFMPAEGRPPLKAEEIAWIRAWVQQGASPSATTIAGVSIRAESKEPAWQPVGDYSSLMGEITQMDKGLGAKLVPVSSKPSDGLVLNTVDIAPSFGDAQLAQLQKFAPYIVEAELGRTAVTDASFDTLAKFTHLRALHLEGTAVTGNGIAKLASLSQLTYLNLSGTKVTQAATAPLASMKNLRHIYLYNTPAQPTQAALSSAGSTP